MQREITVEEICKKLKPIFGKKIDALYMRYQLANTRERREQIANALKVLYEKYLNTNLLTDKILLEPPAENIIKGDFPLGNVVYPDEELYQFGLREQDWIRHVEVSGMSGSGKTNFAFQILGNFIKKGKPFIVFDWKKSFRPLMLMDDEILLFTIGNPRVSNFFKTNILQTPPGVDHMEWISVLADLITESFSASFGVHKLLLEAFDKAFRDFGVYNGSQNFPTMYQIKDRMEAKARDMKGHGRESEWLESVLRICHSLTFGNFGEVVCSKDYLSTSVEELLKKKVIFELHALNTPEKKFFCEFLLTYIYKYMKSNQQGSQDKFNGAILVDEAHNIFLKDRPIFVRETVTDMVYREIREYGISLICLDQHISKLSPTVAGNSATVVAFQQQLPQDVDTVADIMQLRENKRFFTMLPVGSAVVKLAERYHLPFLMRVPLVKLKKEAVIDEDVTERMTSFIKEIRQRKSFEHEVQSLEGVKKQIVAVENVYKASGVDVEAAITDVQTAQEAYEKKKPFIINHLQGELITIILRQRNLGFNDDTIKAHLLRAGFKKADIMNALKVIASKPRKEEDTVVKKVAKDTIAEYLNEEKAAKAFLKSVAKKQLPTTQVYTAIKVSGRKGDELKRELLELGLIQVVEERNEKGLKRMIRLTEEGGRQL